MPLYEYKCDACGQFDLWRSLAESHNPVNCPDCQTPAKRIFSPPMLLSNSLRIKQENPEPRRVKRSGEPKRPRIQSHTDGRPWMISH